MNYPVWQLDFMGGGLLIAFISIVHVFIAHLAVGGGAFLAMTEARAVREDKPWMLDYVRRHAKFFMITSMVFGGVTGVGIWFIISLLAPEGTSVLVHNFVFGWATEWVFFFCEIVALFLYFYTFGKIPHKPHIRLAWLYLLFAWGSLFVISGIIAFMLSPGVWLNTGSFWDGFFNPPFWLSLVFRTFLSLMLTGVFALATAAFVSTEEHRAELVRHCAKWVVLPVIGMAASGVWYFAALPEFHHEIVSGHSPEMRPMLQWAMWTMPVILLVGLAAAIRNPLKLKRPLAVALLVLGMVQIGTFEWVREGGRRPWLVSQYLYSNGIYAEDVSAVNKKGALASAKWVEHKSVTEDNRVAAGRELFMMQCSSCHSIGGPMKDILPRTAKFTVFGMDSQLNGLGKLNRYMPPFVGTREERTALATYIVKGLHGKTEAAAGQQPEDLGAEPLPFDEENDEYILLAWNNLGMHCISDSDRYWTLLPPANDLQAQLILRGEVPEVITEGVTLSYAVEPGFENPAKHVEFWDFEDKLFGTELPENVGLSGNGMTGEMHLDEDRSTFEASLVPVVPYPDDGSFNP